MRRCRKNHIHKLFVTNHISNVRDHISYRSKMHPKESIQTRYDHFGDHHFTHPPILNAPHHNQFNPGKLMATSATFFNSLQLTTGYSKTQLDKCPEPISFGQAFPLKGIFRIKAKVITTTYTDEGRNIMILSSSCSSRTSLY